jgi:hypothetical protein
MLGGHGGKFLMERKTSRFVVIASPSTALQALRINYGFAVAWRSMGAPLDCFAALAMTK